MAPARTKKRGSNGSTAGKQHGTKVPLRDEPSTPKRSPIKKRKAGITARQKQALIDNLQLEITERARRMRAQYHLQAQGLRSRVEIRVNRIPISLRKLKMGDLLQKFIDQEQAALRPPVPAKDVPTRRAPQNNIRSQAANRPQKRLSHEISGDKENESEHGENLKKRVRGNHVTGGMRPAQVLSPTSSNSRLVNRDHTTSPTKNSPSRPGSPLKTNGSRSAAATSMLSSMVEKAKAARSASTKKTNASNANSRAGAAASTAKARRAPATTKGPASRPGTRTGRRASDYSETSEGSATTVVRKGGATKATASSTKKSVMSSIRKGVAASTAKNTTPLPTSSSGRVLRKRN